MKFDAKLKLKSSTKIKPMPENAMRPTAILWRNSDIKKKSESTETAMLSIYAQSPVCTVKQDVTIQIMCFNYLFLVDLAALYLPLVRLKD